MYFLVLFCLEDFEPSCIALGNCRRKLSYQSQCRAILACCSKYQGWGCGDRGHITCSQTTSHHETGKINKQNIMKCQDATFSKQLHHHIDTFSYHLIEIKSALHIYGFHIWGFNQWWVQNIYHKHYVSIELFVIGPEIVPYNNYLHNISIVVCIIGTLEMI